MCPGVSVPVPVSVSVSVSVGRNDGLDDPPLRFVQFEFNNLLVALQSVSLTARKC